MNRETLRRLKYRIERSPDPVTVYTDGKGVWCGAYPGDRAFEVDEMGTYHALCKSYEADAIEAWLMEDFEAAR